MNGGDALRDAREHAEREADRRKQEEIEERALSAIPTYPIEILPEGAQTLVKYGRASGLPATFVAGAALAAMAIAIGPNARIELGGSWMPQRPILWVVNIGPPGSAKSPSQDLAYGYLREQDASDNYELLATDTTIESLARILGGTDGAIGLALDEISSLLRGLGQYKRGAGGDRARYLELWTGGLWKYERVGGAKKADNAVKVKIPRPTVPICGSLQPSFHGLLGGEQDGLRPRWLPHVAGMPTPTPPSAAPTPASWTHTLDELLHARQSPRSWTLDNAARRRFDALHHGWRRRGRGAEMSSVRRAMDKAATHLERIALIFAEADCPSGSGGTITTEQLDRAAKLIEFTFDCWRALPEYGGLALSRRDEVLDERIERLVEYLEASEGRVAIRRDLLRHHIAGVRTAADLDAMRERYTAIYGEWLISYETPPGGGTETEIWTAPVRL